jgi:hypothetical protein
MDIAAANATGFHPDQNFSSRWLGHRHIGHFQLAVFGKQQSFHK